MSTQFKILLGLLLIGLGLTMMAAGGSQLGYIGTYAAGFIHGAGMTLMALAWPLSGCLKGDH